MSADRGFGGSQSSTAANFTNIGSTHSNRTKAACFFAAAFIRAAHLCACVSELERDKETEREEEEHSGHQWDLVSFSFFCEQDL